MALSSSIVHPPPADGFFRSWALVRDAGAMCATSRRASSSGTGAPTARPVRESDASGKTQTPEFRTLELHPEGRRTQREMSVPFDVLEIAAPSERQQMGEGIAETAQNEIWLPTLDSFRTLAA